MSLSARRAWIEIIDKIGKVIDIIVALRKESVDRNSICKEIAYHTLRRSPQGERG